MVSGNSAYDDVVRGASMSATDRPSPPHPYDALVRIGEEFGGSVRLGADQIRHFATLIGDLNPLHHDEPLATASPFGGLIASGPHIASLMMGLFASHFTRSNDGVPRLALGMQFDIKFKAPVRPDRDITMRWRVIERDWKPRRSGWVFTGIGTATSEEDGVLVEIRGTGLVMPGDSLPRADLDPRGVQSSTRRDTGNP
jgi:acyl dehydratase